MNKRVVAAGAALFAATLAAPAGAAVTFTFTQAGNDVVLTGAGSLDLTGARTTCCGVQDGFLNSGSGALAVGGPFGAVAFFYLTSSAGAFGTGSFVNGADAGMRFGMNAVDGGGYLTVFQGYTSGSALSGTTTFANQTFASLGLRPGTYTYRIANDSATVIVPGAVPEPETWAMLILGFGAVGGAMRQRRRASLALA